MLQETQKITASLPKALLHDAQAFTGLGITETIREGLAQLIKARAYEDLRQFRGKLSSCFESFDLDELRKDRDEK